MYNTPHIKAIQTAFAEMQKIQAEIADYCTDDCERCPLNDHCDWEGHIAFWEGITESEIDAFVEKHNRAEEIEQRRTFREATGVDPAWYDFNDDRTDYDR